MLRKKEDIVTTVAELSDGVFGSNVLTLEAPTGRSAVILFYVSDRFEVLYGDQPSFLAELPDMTDDAIAGTVVDTASELNLHPASDLFLFSSRLLGCQEAVFEAIIFHELCHYFVAAGCGGDHGGAEKRALLTADRVRKYTRYHDPMDNEYGHTREWFAVLIHKAARLAVHHPGLFESQQHAVQLALEYDSTGETIEGPWYSG